jgi:hypothetical protein
MTKRSDHTKNIEGFTLLSCSSWFVIGLLVGYVAPRYFSQSAVRSPSHKAQIESFEGARPVPASTRRYPSTEQDSGARPAGK